MIRWHVAAMTVPEAQAKPARDAGTTREALIRAGLDLFGRDGFEATSTRALAAAAGANIGSIAYHFGSKAGLRRACADHIVATAQALIGPLLADLEGAAPPSPAIASERLGLIVEAMVRFIVASSEGERFARFMIREQLDPSEAFERIYASLMAPMHARACGLWAAATGEAAASPEALLSVFALLGQIIYFRVGRPLVLRRLGWETIGRAEADRIVAIIRVHLLAAISAARQARAP